MRGYIYGKLVTVSTGKLTAISIAISVIITIFLTGILSILTLGKISPELLLANSMIGIIVPAIVAPFAVNLLKQATNWEQINQELERENLERKKLEDEAHQKARDMQSINELAVECATATSETDIIKLIAEKLRDITNALGVGVTLYDPASRTLTTKHIAVSGQVLSAANQLVGYNLVGMVNHVTPEMEARMLTGMVEAFSDLSEVSFGLVPKPVAVMIKNTLGVGQFTGMALSHGGKLIGTAIIAHREGQTELNPDVCKTLSHVSAVSIQRKHTENALQDSVTKFSMLIRNLSDGILLLDEQGRIIEWNQSQEALTGFKREDVLGKPIWDVQYQLMPEGSQTPEFYEDTKQTSQKALATGEFTNFNRPIQGVIKTKDGHIKHILQTSFPIPTDSGHRIGSIMRDISQQKQAEADRERLIAELKSKNTELEQFTYTVSHDLKAPLITIKGFLGLLEKDVVGGHIEHMKRDIVRISEATDRMQVLLNELLELSRIGRIVNPSKEVPFRTIVQEAIKAVHGRLEARGVKVDIAGDLPVVFVDQARVTQVVQNILDNAAKFMGQQTHPHITVGVQGTDKDGKPILYIEDNGIGIDSRQFEKVFGLFQKLDATLDGTGIGLALVKRIIEIHGGQIWITSDGIGMGTTVWFTLPVP
jgi:PAS domain S-box-containing protein